MRRQRPSPIWIAPLVLANCNVGDPSDDGARCGSFEACGGDIVGTWGIEASCAGPRAAEDCPQSILRYSSYNRTGTYEFGASGALVMTQRTRSTLHESIPLSCLAGTSCATFESLLESDAGGVGQTVDADATCRDGGSSCSCDVTASIEEMLTGTYEVEGSTLVLSNGVEYDYCVDGSELSLKAGPFEVFLVKF